MYLLNLNIDLPYKSPISLTVLSPRGVICPSKNMDKTKIWTRLFTADLFVSVKSWE